MEYRYFENYITEGIFDDRASVEAIPVDMFHKVYFCEGLSVRSTEDEEGYCDEVDLYMTEDGKFFYYDNWRVTWVKNYSPVWIFLEEQGNGYDSLVECIKKNADSEEAVLYVDSRTSWQLRWLSDDSLGLESEVTEKYEGFAEAMKEFGKDKSVREAFSKITYVPFNEKMYKVHESLMSGDYGLEICEIKEHEIEE
jgi:hypothetical protein